MPRKEYRTPRTLSAVLLALLVAAAARAAEPPVPPKKESPKGPTVSLKSGEKQAILVELYTTETKKGGYEAEKWMASLADDPRLWKSVVPLAFPVEEKPKGYKDSMGQKEFMERLEVYSAKWGQRYSYLPTVTLNGVEWSGWAREESIPEPPPPVVGVLAASKQSTDEVLVVFTPKEDANKDWVAHVALLGFGFVSKPTGGENVSRTLKRDFLVLRAAEKRLDKKRNDYRAYVKLSAKAPNAKALALVAWVTRGENPLPVQAVGGFLGNPPKKKS